MIPLCRAIPTVRLQYIASPKLAIFLISTKISAVIMERSLLRLVCIINCCFGLDASKQDLPEIKLICCSECAGKRCFGRCVKRPNKLASQFQLKSEPNSAQQVGTQQSPWSQSCCERYPGWPLRICQQLPALIQWSAHWALCTSWGQGHPSLFVSAKPMTDDRQCLNTICSADPWSIHNESWVVCMRLSSHICRLYMYNTTRNILSQKLQILGYWCGDVGLLYLHALNQQSSTSKN